jgi:hypothetical protein
MTQLEILSAYLPYNMNVLIPHPLNPNEWMERKLQFDWGHDMNFYLLQGKIKLQLRPLSKLTEEIEVNGERFVPMERLWNNCEITAESEWIQAIDDDPKTMSSKMEFAPYSLAKILLSWHFNIFNIPSDQFVEL